MSPRDSFDDALNSAIDALSRGEHIDSVLARQPRHAAALRPLLESAPFGAAEATRAGAAMSPRLADNFSIVRAAVQRAQMAQTPMAPRIAPRMAPWWQRRLAFASLSLPAGAIALAAFAGISGAAAASVAITNSDFPARVAEFVTHPLPVIGSNRDGDDDANVHTPAASATIASAAQSVSPTPPSSNAPALVTVSGTISDVHGNVFTLTASDGVYKVNTDGTTEITGSIADGATATVTGDATALKNLHATRVEASGASATPTAPGNGNSSGPQNDATPETRTPGANNDNTPGPKNDRTPGPPDGHTPGPPGGHTPPGGGGANGNGNGNGNGGGNGKKP